MKLLTLQFPDETEVTIPRDSTDITVSDGTNIIKGGELIAITDMANPKFVSPTEPVIVTLGPAEEEEEPPA